MTVNARQQAFLALREVYRQGAYTDIALDRVLRSQSMSSSDRGLVTELVYGSVRSQRTLDALIDQFGKKRADQQPPDLRIVLHLGLYQLRYLDRVPASAAVDTSVELAKWAGLGKLAGVVNGMLRQYERSQDDPLVLPEDPQKKFGILYSFPDWVVAEWLEQLGVEEVDRLCQWFNQPPALDLRVNPLKVSIETVETSLKATGVAVTRLEPLPQALRITGGAGAINQLPGFTEGWWTVQDSSAQLVSHLLDPQPGEVIIDACAAPGGKTTHIAELMGDRGKIWACDTANRLRKVSENLNRLQLQSVATLAGDSRQFTQFQGIGDRVLVDAPCSGLGTLHRRPDIRWRQTPEKTVELAKLQQELLTAAASWVKPGGVLVYATCTLNRAENEAVIQEFLQNHPQWQLEAPPLDSPAATFAQASGTIKVWPQRWNMDGFFMAKLSASFSENRL